MALAHASARGVLRNVGGDTPQPSVTPIYNVNPSPTCARITAAGAGYKPALPGMVVRATTSASAPDSAPQTSPGLPRSWRTAAPELGQE